MLYIFFFFFSSRRRHTRCSRDWSSDVCSSDLLDLRPAKNVLEVEGQRDEGEALDRERADRGGRGQREQRPAKQVDRQHRRWMIRLSSDQNPAKQRGGGKFDQHKSRRRVMRSTSDPQNEKAETTRGQQRAGKIEGMRCPRGTRQRLQADQDRDKPERNVDAEQPAPGPDRQNEGGDRRAKREGGRDHHRVVSKTPALQAPRKNETNQRRVDAHDAAGAEALQHARDQQARQ